MRQRARWDGGAPAALALAALALTTCCGIAAAESGGGPGAAMPWQQPVVQPLARHERPSSWRTVIVPAAPEAMAVFAPGGRITTAALPPEGRQGAAPPRPLVGVAHKLEGIASYYWQDQMTASGEVFDKRAMTAAHPTLPLGTRVRVTHLASGRTVVVRINDRGPFVAGRIVDLSLGAAEVIGMTGAGLARVRLDVLP